MTETNEHRGITDLQHSRRYFAKFESIFSHLGRVAAVMETEKSLSRDDVKVLTRYVVNLGFTFKALAMKYLLTGRDTGQFFGSLAIDVRESGFPVFNELLTMANDAQNVAQHLANMPSEAAMKDEMVQRIIRDQEHPTKLQFALSQRHYYEEIRQGQLFWAQNHPEAQWLSNLSEDRRRYLVHWAVYDSEINLPTIYLMEVEDTGRTALPKDQYRWPEAQAHLMGQALAGLKLLTIAKGFDESFDDLHPKRLRRFHIGPMYSSAYTRQNGPIRSVLEEARAPEGSDWAMVWTVEDLKSDYVREERSGWFGKVEREVFALDPMAGKGAEMGATDMTRAIILPQRPFQVLAERNPPGFAGVRKFVVSPNGRVLSY